MALPNFLKNEVGTAKAWKTTGGDYTISLASITTTNGRQGGKGDLGVNRADRWTMQVTASVGAAATAGNTIDYYWAASPASAAGTSNPGGTTGVDASFPVAVIDLLPQLIFVGSLVLSNSSGTAIQTQNMIFVPPFRYGMPVVINNSGQTLGSTATDHTVTLYPIEDGIEASM